MSNPDGKRKPPKLKLDLNHSEVTKEQTLPILINVPPTADQPSTIASDATVNPIFTTQPVATTDCTSFLDSKVKVKLREQGEVLISPDKLDVIQQLGRGQYGIVEKVRHRDSNCDFAVKRVALKTGIENEKTKLLMDVDILIKATDCKNIIKFYGALIWEGDFWILMELMDCSLDKFYRLAHKKVDTPIMTLNSRRLHTSRMTQSPCTHVDETTQLGNCSQCNPIPEKVLGRIAADITNALSYLYSIKVIHRDIKPSNILINQVGTIKLCDFGISGYLVNSVARTYDAGCRPYMAPERIDPPKDRSGYDIKSDVWSFGITMLEIATGRYPYNHTRSFFEQLKSICADPPPKLTQGRFTQEFEGFIDMCLEKDYQSRPKYDSITSHQFIVEHKDLDISDFTAGVLANLDPVTRA